MNCTDKKCVIIIDKELPLGLIANTSAILGCTLGKSIGSIVGEDVSDIGNFPHKGIVKIPIPILSSTKNKIRDLYTIVKEKYSKEITIIDFNDIAQKCKIYDDYIQRLSCTDSSELNYLGICFYGSKKTITSLTGSLPTLK